MKSNFFYYLLYALGGLFLGWLLFHSSATSSTSGNQLIVKQAESEKEQIWSCAMHPQIRLHEPGKCPICGMELILLTQGNSSSMDPNAVHLTKDAVQLANVQTSVVSHQRPVKEVRLYGKVQADERLLQSQVSFFPGRIEKLLVNFTGERVQKGQTLAQIYSPQLVSAQQELQEAAKMKLAQPEIHQAAKERLHQWKLTDQQIERIESSGAAMTSFDIVSNTSGIVTSRRVNNGDYVSEGAVLFEVADLSHLWVMFDAYESDLPFLAMGQKLDFTAQALPGVTFSGAINFIDPAMDPATRVAKVRVEINNDGQKLKPEMFVIGQVQADLNLSGNALVIPRSAVLWTGQRSIVYLKVGQLEEALFKLREIELGESLGNSYVVLSGLADGDQIVTQGAFSIDAASQLEGKSSMMNGKIEIKGNNEIRGNREIEIKGDKDLRGVGTTEKSDFGVAGNCDQCKDRIEKATRSVDGVESSVWVVSTRMLHVEFNPQKTSLAAIQRAILKAGHDVGNAKAEDEIYKGLPACCKYRK